MGVCTTMKQSAEHLAVLSESDVRHIAGTCRLLHEENVLMLVQLVGAASAGAEEPAVREFAWKSMLSARAIVATHEMHPDAWRSLRVYAVDVVMPIALMVRHEREASALRDAMADESESSHDGPLFLPGEWDQG